MATLESNNYADQFICSTSQWANSWDARLLTYRKTPQSIKEKNLNSLRKIVCSNTIFSYSQAYRERYLGRDWGVVWHVASEHF
jgi:hypothetical protein